MVDGWLVDNRCAEPLLQYYLYWSAGGRHIAYICVPSIVLLWMCFFYMGTQLNLQMIWDIHYKYGCNTIDSTAILVIIFSSYIRPGGVKYRHNEQVTRLIRCFYYNSCHNVVLY